MTIKSALLLAGLGVLLTPAFAAPPPAVPATAKGEFVPPVPLHVTSPVRAPSGYENATIELQLVVDERGCPCLVDTVGLVPTEVRELVVTAVRNWTFRPATLRGTPVSVQVILPLKLAVAN